LSQVNIVDALKKSQARGQAKVRDAVRRRALLVVTYVARRRYESRAPLRFPGFHDQMLDGFNQGWIEFEGGKAGSEKGSIELVTVLHNLVENNDLR
jgi:hypothetical protein